jgi:hypothetical protein
MRLFFYSIILLIISTVILQVTGLTWGPQENSQAKRHRAPLLQSDMGVQMFHFRWLARPFRTGLATCRETKR